MKLLRALCTVLGLFATTAVAQQTTYTPLKPLYSAYHAEYTDNFYTLNAAEHSLAVSSYGYGNTGVVAYMEGRQQPNTRPFKRFFIGPPQLEHFYTADPSEESFVLANGYVYEGIEGYIYTTQVPGSVPLYRAVRFEGATGDLVHKYTVDIYEVYSLMGQGWGSDGIQGYVYTTPEPRVAGGTIIGLRCPSAQPWACGPGAVSNHRAYFFGSIGASDTFKPRGKTIQRMRFRMSSPDYFGTTSSNGSTTGSADHLFFSLHGRFSLGHPDITRICSSQQTISASCSWHRGLGPIIYGRSTGSDNSQVHTESWFVDWPGNTVKRGSNPGNLLLNDRDYWVDIQVSDFGVIKYTITDLSTGQVVKADHWNASGEFPASSPFPRELTGYTVGHAQVSERDYTVYITEFRVDWL